MISKTWKLDSRNKKVAFIFSNVVGTVTRADLFHKSNGDISRGFYPYMCTSLYIRACVGESQEGSLGVTASQMLTLLHAPTP